MPPTTGPRNWIRHDSLSRGRPGEPCDRTPTAEVARRERELGEAQQGQQIAGRVKSEQSLLGTRARRDTGAMTNNPTPAPFSRIKIRTGALVFCGDDVALIRRDRADSVHYSPPGGNVEHGEDLDAALARELAEELLLDTALAEGGDLLWVVDQRVTRPGPTPPPRKLHLIYRFHISSDVRATLAEQELDELPDGSHEVGVIEWIDYRKTAELPIFPPIGPALAALTCPRAAVADAALEAVTDANYTWV